VKTRPAFTGRLENVVVAKRHFTLVLSIELLQFCYSEGKYNLACYAQHVLLPPGQRS
jgi:hypothetical protein